MTGVIIDSAQFPFPRCNERPGLCADLVYGLILRLGKAIWKCSKRLAIVGKVITLDARAGVFLFHDVLVESWRKSFVCSKTGIFIFPSVSVPLSLFFIKRAV